MTYDTNNPLDAKRALERVAFLVEKKRPIEVTDKSIRSLQQNRYLHLILGLLAMETGNTLEYVKTEYFKKGCNPDIFVVKRYDAILRREVEHVKSSKDVSREEMSVAIDRYRKFCAENGFPTPSPEDKAYLQMIEIDMGRMKSYL